MSNRIFETNWSRCLAEPGPGTCTRILQKWKKIAGRPSFFCRSTCAFIFWLGNSDRKPNVVLLESTLEYEAGSGDAHDSLAYFVIRPCWVECANWHFAVAVSFKLKHKLFRSYPERKCWDGHRRFMAKFSRTRLPQTMKTIIHDSNLTPYAHITDGGHLGVTPLNTRVFNKESD